MTPPKIKCTALTAKGEPCSAWAIHDSSPPRCAPHAGLARPPKGNSNAVTHGYYQRRVKPEELATLFDNAAGIDLTAETILIRVLLHRLSEYLVSGDIPLAEIKSIAPLIFSGSRALAHLQKHLPDPNAIDWETALDELGEEWGWDL